MGVHPFGCFVQLYPGKEGLVHVSELDIGRVSDVEGSFKVTPSEKICLLLLFLLYVCCFLLMVKG